MKKTNRKTLTQCRGRVFITVLEMERATKEEEVSSPQIVDTDSFLKHYWLCYIRNLNKYKCVVLILQFLWCCLDSC